MTDTRTRTELERVRAERDVLQRQLGHALAKAVLQAARIEVLEGHVAKQAAEIDALEARVAAEMRPGDPIITYWYEAGANDGGLADPTYVQSDPEGGAVGMYHKHGMTVVDHEPSFPYPHFHTDAGGTEAVEF